MANYPASKDELFAGTSDTVAATDQVDGVPGPGALSVLLNAVADSINAIQDELGLDPAGAAATLVARLDALDTTVAANLANIVEDLTPQLGANLDLNGFTITGLVIGTNVQAWSAVLDATTASFLIADETKLDAIEASADVTDAVNVAAAGAPIITSGAGAPVSTPAAVGDIYVDTTGDIGWVAAGTASSADWKQATGAGGGDLLAANNLSDVANAGTARTNLGVAIGSDVQAYAAALDSVTGTNTGDEVAASTIAAGVAEIATSAEIDTGTDDTRTVSPLGLAGSALQTKVDGIEVSATADQTGAEIKTAYEAEADTNAYDDAAVSKLGAIEASADVTDAVNVAAAGAPIISSGAGAPVSTPATEGDLYIDTTGDRAYIATGAVSSADWDLLPITAADLSLVIGTDVQAWSAVLDALAAQTDLPVVDGGTGASDAGTARTNLGVAIGSDVQAWSAVLDATTASFLIADETKLDGIEALADVTDATNVGAAGAVMDTLADAKGDVFGASAADTVTRLAVGTNDQVLTADSAEATGLKWAAVALASAADEVEVQVRNESGSTMNIGQAVYVSGWNVGNSIILVSLADADAAGTMPALGIIKEEILNNAQGACVLSGIVSGFDTSSFSTGDGVFTSGTAGALTATKPTGTALVQKVGIVLRDHATLGSLLVIGAGRTNDVPNIASANFWVGNASAVATAVAMSGDATMTNAGVVTVTDIAPAADLDMGDYGLLQVANIESKIIVNAATGATETLDTSLAGWFDMTMDEACTFTFSNPAASAEGTMFVLDLAGAFAVTWPASVDWDSGSAPTYATPSQFVFSTNDGGTTWLGSMRGSGFA